MTNNSIFYEHYRPTDLMTVIASFLILFSISAFLVADQSYASPKVQGPSITAQSTSDTLQSKKLLQRYLTYALPATPPQKQSTVDENLPVKCLAPVIKDYEQLRPALSVEARQLMDRLVYERPLQEAAMDSLLSPSGKFKLKYTTSGQDSVPATDRDNNGVPDYVEWAANYADSTWRAEIEQLGYPDPLEKQDAPYEIYFDSVRTYGYTQQITGESGTYMVVNNNFNGFPANTDPEGNRKGALKVTIAHEFKHAINYFITDWQGEIDKWAEMDATLMEELVFDPVNDYYNYINSAFSIFNAPELSLYPGSYEHVSFAIYFTEHFGPLFWSALWDNIVKSQQNRDPLNMIPAIDSTLRNYDNQHFEHHFTRNHLWHFASGSSRVTSNFGFEERFAEFKGGYAYPKSNLTSDYDTLGVPDSMSTWSTVSNLSAHHISIKPLPSDHGPVQIELEYDSTKISVGLLAYSEGEVKTHFTTSQHQKTVSITPGWWWGRLERLGLVVANSEPDNFGVPYRIKFGTLENPIYPVQLPDKPQLNPNYPNPFNQSTTLSFVLPHTQDVTIRVYDVTGRLIQTLQRNRLNPGPHKLRFDAGGLASGVYIYQLITEEQIDTGKMMLVK